MVYQHAEMVLGAHMPTNELAVGSDTYIGRPLMAARRHAVNERSSTRRGRDEHAL